MLIPWLLSTFWFKFWLLLFSRFNLILLLLLFQIFMCHWFCNFKILLSLMSMMWLLYPFSPSKLTFTALQIYDFLWLIPLFETCGFYRCYHKKTLMSLQSNMWLVHTLPWNVFFPCFVIYFCYFSLFHYFSSFWVQSDTTFMFYDLLFLLVDTPVLKLGLLLLLNFLSPFVSNFQCTPVLHLIFIVFSALVLSDDIAFAATWVHYSLLYGFSTNFTVFNLCLPYVMSLILLMMVCLLFDPFIYFALSSAFDFVVIWLYRLLFYPLS